MCIGLLLGVVFNCQATPMYGPTAWHLVFLAINAGQIHQLVIERRRLTLGLAKSRFAEETFGDRSRDELLTLLTDITTESPETLRTACGLPATPDPLTRPARPGVQPPDPHRDREPADRAIVERGQETEVAERKPTNPERSEQRRGVTGGAQGL